MTERVLIVANGHPVYSKGGAEAVAYRQFQEYDTRDDVDAMFLAAHPAGPIENGTRLSCRGEKEILFSVQEGDYFKHSQPYKRGIRWHFREILETFDPTIVHFHHFVHLGIEMLREVHNFRKDLPIILTLHEFIAICNQNGQMVKKGSHQLCYSESPADCHECFPDISTGDFLLRKLYLRSFLDLVDRFVCPSQFLLERYANWGIPREKLLFIENGYAATSAPGPDSDGPFGSTRLTKKGAPGEVPADPDVEQEEFGQIVPSPRRRSARSRGRLGSKVGMRFGFFGQVNPFKGVDVFLEAIRRLERSDQRKIEVTIHGGGVETWPELFQDQIAELAKKTEGCVRFHGKYEAEDLSALMTEVDWVVMPSIWWENSPVVIQEAFHHCRPVICSNIGGMKEKVRDGIDGVHFAVGNPGSLARVIESIIDGDVTTSDFHPNIVQPVTVVEKANEHLELYAKVRSEIQDSDSVR